MDIKNSEEVKDLLEHLEQYSKVANKSITINSIILDIPTGGDSHHFSISIFIDKKLEKDIRDLFQKRVDEIKKRLQTL